MPDFAVVKELHVVEQHIASYRCSGASLVQALCIRRPLLELQTLLVSKPRQWPWTHGGLAILLESSFCVSAVTWSLSTVKHGFFTFLNKWKTWKTHWKLCMPMLFFYVSYSCWPMRSIIGDEVWYKSGLSYENKAHRWAPHGRQSALASSPHPLPLLVIAWSRRGPNIDCLCMHYLFTKIWGILITTYTLSKTMMSYYVNNVSVISSNW